MSVLERGDEAAGAADRGTNGVPLLELIGAAGFSIVHEVVLDDFHLTRRTTSTHQMPAWLRSPRTLPWSPGHDDHRVPEIRVMVEQAPRVVVRPWASELIRQSDAPVLTRLLEHSLDPLETRVDRVSPHRFIEMGHEVGRSGPKSAWSWSGRLRLSRKGLAELHKYQAKHWRGQEFNES